MDMNNDSVVSLFLDREGYHVPVNISYDKEAGLIITSELDFFYEETDINVDLDLQMVIPKRILAEAIKDILEEINNGY